MNCTTYQLSRSLCLFCPFFFGLVFCHCSFIGKVVSDLNVSSRRIARAVNRTSGIAESYRTHRGGGTFESGHKVKMSVLAEVNWTWWTRNCRQSPIELIARKVVWEANCRILVKTSYFYIFVLKKSIKMHSRPVFLRALRLRQQPLPARRFLPPQSLRPISSTARLLDESKKSEQQSQKKKSTNDEPITPRSPWAVFTQVLKEEIEKNKGWQDNVKQLQGDVDKFADSAAMKRAKDVYEKTRVSRLNR